MKKSSNGHRAMQFESIVAAKGTNPDGLYHTNIIYAVEDLPGVWRRVPMEAKLPAGVESVVAYGPDGEVRLTPFKAMFGELLDAHFVPLAGRSPVADMVEAATRRQAETLAWAGLGGPAAPKPPSDAEQDGLFSKKFEKSVEEAILKPDEAPARDVHHESNPPTQAPPFPSVSPPDAAKTAAETTLGNGTPTAAQPASQGGGDDIKARVRKKLLDRDNLTMEESEWYWSKGGRQAIDEDIKRESGVDVAEWERKASERKAGGRRRKSAAG